MNDRGVARKKEGARRKRGLSITSPDGLSEILTLQFNRAPADRVCKPCGPQPLVEKAASSTSVSDQQLEAAYEIILRAIGEDPSREGLRKTPARAAKAMRALTSGYSVVPSELARDALFTVDPRSEEPLGMVVVVRYPYLSPIFRPCTFARMHDATF